MSSKNNTLLVLKSYEQKKGIYSKKLEKIDSQLAENLKKYEAIKKSKLYDFEFAKEGLISKMSFLNQTLTDLEKQWKTEESTIDESYNAFVKKIEKRRETATKNLEKINQHNE